MGPPPSSALAKADAGAVQMWSLAVKDKVPPQLLSREMGIRVRVMLLVILGMYFIPRFKRKLEKRGEMNARDSLTIFLHFLIFIPNSPQ